MRRILTLLGEELPVGPDWHAALLRRIGQPLPERRPALFSTSLIKAVFDLMRFRHVALHAYDGFDFERAAPTMKSAETFLARIDAEIAAFRAAIDPD